MPAESGCRLAASWAPAAAVPGTTVAGIGNTGTARSCPAGFAGPGPVWQRPGKEELWNTAEAPERLALEVGLADGIAVVQVTGEVDVASCGVLRDSLLRIVTDEGFGGLVVNLAGVRVIDSAGVGVLVGVWRAVHATTGRLALAAPAPQARRVLDTASLTKILPVYDAEADAVHAARQPPAR
jgi:anti-anti-sigma factor